jgi:tetrahydromethanopterin S-methyltransferase subunit F
MQYTLITRDGKVMQFHNGSVAQTFKGLYGGVVFSQQILKEPLTIATIPV